jgi:hypothetical protein
MSIFNVDFKDFHPDTKRVLLNLVFVMPFWYMFIYFYNPILLKEDFTTTIIFAFCLSFLFSTINFLFTLLNMVFLFCSTSFKDKIDSLLLEVNSMICALLICIFVLLNINNNCSFYYILFNALLYFKINGLLCVFTFVWRISRSCNKKER